MDPITSTLLQNEPEYADLVEEFVKRLPPTVTRIIQLFDQIANQMPNPLSSNANWLQLKKEVHDLKGMGGGFGYPMLTELAGKIDSQIKPGNIDMVKTLLKELDVLSARIVLGMAKYHQQKCA